MRPRTQRFLPWCIIALLAAAAAFAQAVTLTGTVVGADKKPRAFARIQLQGQAQYAAVSDVNGKFTIPNFTPGTYAANIRQNDNVQKLTVDIEGTTTTLVVSW